jgi:hypothetical protein
MQQCHSVQEGKCHDGGCEHREDRQRAAPDRSQNQQLAYQPQPLTTCLACSAPTDESIHNAKKAKVSHTLKKPRLPWKSTSAPTERELSKNAWRILADHTKCCLQSQAIPPPTPRTQPEQTPRAQPCHQHSHSRSVACNTHRLHKQHMCRLPMPEGMNPHEAGRGHASAHANPCNQPAQHQC